MKTWRIAALVAAHIGLAACTSPGAQRSAAAASASVAAAPSAPAASAASTAEKGPPADCLAALDRLSQGIPRDETGPILSSKGLRIKTPIRVPDDVVTEKATTSGARVRVMINSKGEVIPGSVTVQQAIGDPKLPLAMTDVVPATLSFDVSGAFTVPKEFAFTTVYVNCARP